MNIESFAFYVSVLRKNFLGYCSEKLSDMGLTYSQLFIIIHIGKHTQCTPKSISEYLKLDAGQLNRSLAKLAEDNFINQIKSEKDKRVTILTLTEKGERVFKESHEIFFQWDEEILAELDSSSKEKLMDVMKKLALTANEKRKDKENG